MERSSRVIKLCFIWMIILVFSYPTGQLLAGVVLAPPPDEPPLPRADENYPRSRFGASTESPDLGVPPSYSIKKVNEMQDLGEVGDPDKGSSASRRPAGLEFSHDTGQVRSTPVILDEEMPKSSSNQNPKPSTVSRTGVQEIALIAGDLGFFPKNIIVTRDIPVKIFVTGASKKALCLMMDSFQIRKQIRSQRIEEVDFIPNSSGQFRFYCPVNGMEGTLLVKDISSMMRSENSTQAETHAEPPREPSKESLPPEIAQSEKRDETPLPSPAPEIINRVPAQTKPPEKPVAKATQVLPTDGNSSTATIGD